MLCILELSPEPSLPSNGGVIEIWFGPGNRTKCESTLKLSLTRNWTLTSVSQTDSSADRQAVSTHLPLASSRSSPAEDQNLMSKLEELAVKFNC